MKPIEQLRKLALLLPETTEEPHFEKISFRVKKKIFATFDERTNLASLKFTELNQFFYTSIDSRLIYPVPNKWGKQGWTLVELNKVKAELLKEMLETAYKDVSAKK